MEALAARALGRGEHGDMAKPGAARKTARGYDAGEARGKGGLAGGPGQEDFFLTADGAPVLLSVDTLMHIQPRRSTFVPLIPELLSDPFEVWMDFEEHEATGRVELKKRYLKRVDTGERETGILMVVQVVKGQLAGWTFIPAERGKYLNNIRRGKLVWAREG